MPAGILCSSHRYLLTSCQGIACGTVPRRALYCSGWFEIRQKRGNRVSKRRIDWYYHRRNCEACEKADAALAGVEIVERVDARKTRFERAAAIKLARTMRWVVATRGGKSETFEVGAGVSDEALAKAIMGPTGNLRAPSMRVGDTLYVGFSDLILDARTVSRAAPPAAGYSGTPLSKKLGIFPGAQVHVVGGPANYESLLTPLPAAVRFVANIDEATDIVHLFCTRRADLERRLRAILPRIRPDAAIWVSWPKKASGVATDITENTIREVALPLGLVDVKVCAVDATWSGLKLMVRVANRPSGRRKHAHSTA